MTEAELEAMAPQWYSKDEMYHFLRCRNYSEQIAQELAELIATNYQLAFAKGFDMGRRSVKAERWIE